MSSWHRHTSDEDESMCPAVCSTMSQGLYRRHGTDMFQDTNTFTQDNE